MLKNKIIFLICSLSTLLGQFNLSSRYHTFDEIVEKLDYWNSEYGEIQNPIYHQEIIGYSTNDNLPIWAIKISDNADLNEDEPRVLILGMCHAEEIYGIEIAMSLIEQLLNDQSFLEDLEIWVIPTYNPEGLRVVHGYIENEVDTIQDVSFRKNKRDVNQNQEFDFNSLVEAGSDSDGVDLNRNFGFNWVFGDTAYALDGGCGDYVSHYDYYKGAAPFSESETQAIRDFAIEKSFLLSIAYHSSRSGCVSERVIYPWLWEETKKSPDYEVIKNLGEEIASLIPKENEALAYHVAPSSRPRGNAHDWFYTETGCIQYLIEVGTDNMQSNDTLIIEDTIDRNMEGLEYLLHRAAGTYYDNQTPQKFQITGIVKDAVSGQIVQDAIVNIVELNGKMLKDRKTNEFGRYHRLLKQATYNLEVAAYGYQKYYYFFIPSGSVVLNHDVELIPLDQYNLTIDIIDESDADFVNLSLTDMFGEYNYTLNEGINILQFYPGEYQLTILPQEEGMFFPIKSSLFFDNDTTIEFTLNTTELFLYEDFSSLDGWTIQSGAWQIQNEKLVSQAGLNYDSNEHIKITKDFYFGDSLPRNAILKLNVGYEVEWDFDTIKYQLTNNNNKHLINYWSSQNWDLHEEYYQFPMYIGDNQLSIEIISDSTVNFRGLKLDDLTIWIDNHSPLHNKANQLIPENYYISQNYPNPFNPVTEIEFNIPHRNQVFLSIYNIRGENVLDLINGEIFNSGTYRYSIDASVLSSGIYFYKINTEYWTETKKMLLIK